MTSIIIREQTGPGIVINDGSPAALAAAVRAETAAAAAEAVGATNDAIMASVAANPGSAFSVQQRAALEQIVHDVTYDRF